MGRIACRTIIVGCARTMAASGIGDSRRARTGLAAVLAAFLSSSPAAAVDLQVRNGDAPFCTRLDSLERFVLTAARRGMLTFDDPLCYRLKAGVRLEVTGDVATLGKVEVYAVTVHGSGGDVDGFTLSNRVEGASHPAIRPEP